MATFKSKRRCIEQEKEPELCSAECICSVNWSNLERYDVSNDEVEDVENNINILGDQEKELGGEFSTGQATCSDIIFQDTYHRVSFFFIDWKKESDFRRGVYVPWPLTMY